MASTICRICRRRLTDPVNIAREMGPTCAKKMGLQTTLMPPDADHVLTPFTGNVVVRRSGGKKYMNIPQTIVKHSPTGMEWGYGGSGPADLALNILFYVTKDRRFAEAHYQEFKWDYVAMLPEEGGEISGDEIAAFIQNKKAGN